MSGPKKLRIERATLIKYAQKNLADARKNHEQAEAAFTGQVLTAVEDAENNLDKIRDRVGRARSMKKVAEAARSFQGYSVYDPPSQPSNSEVCRWKQRLDWLKAASDEHISLDVHELSEYIREKC